MGTRNSFSAFWLPALSLCWRELIRFYRFRSRVLGALGTPLVFWLLIGSGIGTSLRVGATAKGISYLEYFFPGTLLLILLFTSIFTMISVIEDRHEGFLLSVLVAPIPRAAMVLGKAWGASAVAVVQALLFLLIAPLAGIPVQWSRTPLLVGVLLLIALALTALGFIVAWLMDSVQGFHGVANLLFFPLWMLSGALFPAEGASTWIRLVMRLNPLTYALGALRFALYGEGSPAGSGTPSPALSLTITAGFAVAMLVAAIGVARRSARGSLG